MLATENAPVGLAELGKFRLFKKKKKKKAPPPPPPTPAYPAYPGAPAPGAPLTPEQQQAESSEVMKEFIKTAGQSPKPKPQSSSVFISAATDHPYLFWGLVGGGSLLVVGLGLFFFLRKK